VPCRSNPRQVVSSATLGSAHTLEDYPSPALVDSEPPASIVVLSIPLASVLKTFDATVTLRLESRFDLLQP
jgi:hypothetical protein